MSLYAVHGWQATPQLQTNASVELRGKTYEECFSVFGDQEACLDVTLPFVRGRTMGSPH